MIRISCTNCKTVLSIDDAFAGGVCRCQHCGTIQTVPAHARETAAAGVGGAGVTVSGQSMGGGKSHFQQDPRSGTGLDDLAGVVVSSGLASSRLTRSSSDPLKKNLVPLIVAGAIVMAILVVVIIYMATRMASEPANTGTGGSNNPNSSTVSGTSNQATNGPNFCGATLAGDTVIYILDCGDATNDFLGDLKQATIKSIESLGTNRKFEIIFWNNGTDGAYPQNSTTYATKENVDSAHSAIEPIYGSGASDIQDAFKIALEQHPDEIVIATAKGWQLASEWDRTVMDLRGNSPVKVVTFNLGSNGESAPLSRLAEHTGGSYHEITKGELHGFGQ